MTQTISIELADVDREVVLVRVTTAIGIVEIMGAVRIDGRVMWIDRAHVDGPGPGTLGRSGLNAIAERLLVEADVDQVVVQGNTRTTGRNAGRRPKAFCYPR